MTSAEKNHIRDSLISSVVSLWKSKDLNVLDKRTLERKFERLIIDNLRNLIQDNLHRNNVKGQFDINELDLDRM